jgi:putative SOS response-associated peptidase YedK
MCGRFAFYSPHEAIVRLFQLPDGTPEIEPRYNIAPTMFVPAVRDSGDAAATRRLAMLYWGLVPAWAKDKASGARMINARSETLRDKPAYRDAYKYRRALVAADGYYEWMKLGGNLTQPYFIQPASGAPFAFGALWESWRDPASGEPLESCAIITASAAPALAHIHDRMPLIITRENYAEWLDRANRDLDRLDRLLDPAHVGELVARPVGRRVGNARNEGPDLIEQVKPIRPPPTPGDPLF